MTQVSRNKPKTAGNGYVSYIVFEGELTRMERVQTHLLIVCFVLLLLLILTNAFWIMRYV